MNENENNVSLPNNGEENITVSEVTNNPASESTETNPTDNQMSLGNKQKNIFSKITTKIKEIGTGPVIAGTVVVVVLLAFVIFKATTSSPKAIFKNVINDAYKEVHKYLNDAEKFDKKYDLEKEPVSFSADVKLDSSMEELKDYTDYKFTVNGGYNLKDEKANVKVALEGNDTKLDAKVDLVEGKQYLSSSLFDQVIDITEETGIDTDIFEEIKKELDENNVEINFEDYDYILKTAKNALIKSMDKKQLEKEKDEIEVDGKEIKATKVTYVLDKGAVKDLVKNVCEELLNDKDFISKVAKATGQDKDDIKDALKTLKSSAKDIDFDNDIEINLFIKGLFNKVVGFSISIDDKDYLTIYNSGKKTELVVNNHEDSDYSKVKLVALAEDKGKETEINVKYNGENVADLTVREFKEDVIDLDYSVYAEDQEIKGTIYLTEKEKKNTFSGEYKVSVKAGDDIDLTVSGNYSIEIGKDLDEVKTSDAVSMDEVDFDKIEDNITKAIEKDEKLKELFESSFNEIKEDSLDLNSIGMKAVDNEEDAIKLLSNEKATVLYVGDTYYYDSKENAMVSNLIDLQDELDFYSYYLNDYDAEEDFWAATKDAPYTCEVTSTDTTDNQEGSTKCNETPVIYIIKDGKIIKGIRGTITPEELKKALNDVGIN